MKKILILAFSSLLFIGATMTSCKKTNKSKVSNEWRVSKMSSVSEQSTQNVTTSVIITNLEGEKGTKETKNTSFTSGTTFTTNEIASVDDFSYTIQKDGTWASNKKITWTYNFDDGSSVDIEETVETGTWSFLGKNKLGEFKQNERIVFSILSKDSKKTNIYNSDGFSSTSEDHVIRDYAEGQNTITYRVLESKNKELVLESDKNEEFTSTTTGDSNTYFSKEKTTISLVKK